MFEYSSAIRKKEHQKLYHSKEETKVTEIEGYWYTYRGSIVYIGTSVEKGC